MSLTRLLRFLTLLALVLSPIAMLAGTPARASAHHMMSAPDAASMPAGPCHDADGHSKDRPVPATDCAVACAATMPGLGDAFAALPPPVGARQRPVLVSIGHGLGPEAVDPPPRRA